MGQPEVIRFGPSSSEILGLGVSLGILCVLSILCIGLAAGLGDWSLLAQAGFWGALAWINYVALRPERIYLELSPDGFTERQVFFTWTHRWNDLDCFGTVTDDGGVVVVFRYADGYKRSIHPRSRLWRNGWSSRLMGNYDMSAEKLAELLNSWRLRYSRKPAGKAFVDDLL
jgi:hypothetical protein